MGFDKPKKGTVEKKPMFVNDLFGEASPAPKSVLTGQQESLNKDEDEINKLL